MFSFRRPRCGPLVIISTPMAFVMAFHQCARRLCLRICTLRCMFVANGLILILNILFYAANSGLILTSVEVHFMPPLDSEHRVLLDLTFQAFTEALESNNVTYFIFTGTLVGSWRHHGRIPWDDDIDVLVSASDRQAVSRALRLKAAEDPTSFGLYDWAMSGRGYAYQWKFYPRNGKGLFYKNFRTPNVDIFFYMENTTHIWNASPFFSSSEVWLKSHVFPLRRRPFGKIVVPAPCNPEAFLGANFDVSVCQSRRFSHVFDLPLPFLPLSVPCQRLDGLYPFVRRTTLSSGLSQESLVFQGKTLDKFITAMSC